MRLSSSSAERSRPRPQPLPPAAKSRLHRDVYSPSFRPRHDPCGPPYPFGTQAWDAELHQLRTRRSRNPGASGSLNSGQRCAASKHRSVSSASFVGPTKWLRQQRRGKLIKYDCSSSMNLRCACFGRSGKSRAQRRTLSSYSHLNRM